MYARCTVSVPNTPRCTGKQNLVFCSVQFTSAMRPQQKNELLGLVSAIRTMQRSTLTRTIACAVQCTLPLHGQLQCAMEKGRRCARSQALIRGRPITEFGLMYDNNLRGKRAGRETEDCGEASQPALFRWTAHCCGSPFPLQDYHMVLLWPSLACSFFSRFCLSKL